MWKGRRGLVNTIACCALSLPCAFGLWLLAERSTIVPACTSYARAHGAAYLDFKLVGVKHASTVVCLLAEGNGKVLDVHLNELIPYITNLLVELAMTLELTVPAFAVLLAMTRVFVFRRMPPADA
jgi:hypothetical protein